MSEMFRGIIQSTVENTPATFFALLFLVALDYITGICVAIYERKVSSRVGAKGIARKVMTFSMVAVSAIVDAILIQDGNFLCSLTILFYCANELFSILENACRIGLPLPKKLTDIIATIRKKAE